MRFREIAGTGWAIVASVLFGCGSSQSTVDAGHTDARTGADASVVDAKEREGATTDAPPRDGHVSEAAPGDAGHPSDAAPGDASHPSDAAVVHSCEAGAYTVVASLDGGVVKSPIVGLIQMGPGGRDASVNDNAIYNPDFGLVGNNLDDIIARPNVFSGVVINIPWLELQPTSGDSLNTCGIDSVLATMRAYNAGPSITLPLHAILRVFAEAYAPDWVKSMGGGPITAWDSLHQVTYTVAHFWSADYAAAWRNLEALLAARYDQEPLLSEVCNTSCTSADDEAFALARAYSTDAAGGISTIRNLHDAGFTDQAYETCLLNGVHDYDAWTHTFVTHDVGPLFLSNDAGPYTPLDRDYAFVQTFIAAAKAATGSRTILSNHTLNYPPEAPSLPAYVDMAEAGTLLEWQTHSPNGLNWQDTVNEVVCIGHGNALELWNATGAGGYTTEPDGSLQGWATELATTTTNGLCAQLKAEAGL